MSKRELKVDLKSHYKPWLDFFKDFKTTTWEHHSARIVLSNQFKTAQISSSLGSMNFVRTKLSFGNGLKILESGNSQSSVTLRVASFEVSLPQRNSPIFGVGIVDSKFNHSKGAFVDASCANYVV
jgi:hypothetical protein